MSSDFSSKVQQLVSDCIKYDLPVDDLATRIIQYAYPHSDEDVKRVLLDLPSEISHEIFNLISKFNESGMFLVIWGSGQTEDLAEPMARVSRLFALDSR